MIVCRETYRPCTYSAIGGAGKGRDMFTGRRNSASCKVHPGCKCVIVSPLQAALSDGGQVGSMKSPARGHPQIPQGTNWAVSTQLDSEKIRSQTLHSFRYQWSFLWLRHWLSDLSGQGVILGTSGGSRDQWMTFLLRLPGAHPRGQKKCLSKHLFLPGAGVIPL